MKKLMLLLLVFTSLGLLARAQDSRVSGRVTNSATGEPIEGISVKVKGKAAGAVTNADGIYSVAARTGDVLLFSGIGISPKEVTVNGAVVDVTLNVGATNLNEVVVVGYGTQKKANLTGSVVTLKQSDLLKRQVATASNLLQGLATGVTVQQQSGKPGGDGASIRIRGLSSIYAGQSPLILVDGVVSSLDNIDPNAIESITVLKDAASTAIYGTRAANGVILVKTKRATQKGIKVSYNTFISKQMATAIPERTSAVEHMELSNVAEQNRTGNPNAFVFPQSLIDKYKTTPANNLDVINSDWLKLLLTNSGLMQNHNVTLSSGGDFVDIFTSITYLNQQGLIPNNSFSKYDIRFNPDFKIRKNLTLSGVFNYNNSETITPSTSSPEFIIRQAIGLPAIGAAKFGPGMYGNAGQTNNRNPLAQAEAAGTAFVNTNSILSKIGLQYQPIKNLDLEAYWAREYWVPHSKSFVKNVDIYQPNLSTSSYDKIGVWPGSTSLGESYSTNIRTTTLAQGTYHFNINKHAVKFLAGAQSEKFHYEGISASRTGFDNPNQPYLNLGASDYNNSGSAYEYALAGFYSRLNYSYDEKYLLELNGRYDGSSRFSQALNKQWGFFPSASAGWIFSRENFLGSLNDIINFGKLRVSYGVLGNQALPDIYPFAVNFGTSTFSNPYNGTYNYINNVTTLGYALLDAPNPEITWEKSKQLNAGIDLTLVKKFNVTFDYYVRNISDILLVRPIPNYVGLNPPYVNAGTMEDRGWEFSLNYKTKINKLYIDATAMISDVQNKVKSLPGVPYLDGGSVRTAPGYALFSYFGYQALGYFQDTNDIKNSPVQFGVPYNPNGPSGPKPGDVKYADISGPDGKPDGKVDSYDRTFIGNNFPRYEYSININLSYKNFDLNLFGQGVGKRDNYLSGTGAIPFNSADFIASLLKIHENYWTPSNPNADFPRLLPSGSGGTNFVTSSKWVRSAAYFRIKNINLGYRLPEEIVKKLGISGVRVYVSAQNLVTFSSSWKGFDPEINNADGQFYPLMKTFTAGLNVNF